MTSNTRRGTGAAGFVAFALLGAIAMASCSSSSNKTTNQTDTTTAPVATTLFSPADMNQPQHTGTPVEGGSMSFGLEASVATLTPGNIQQPSDWTVADAVYDPIVGFDSKGLPAPVRLASKWSNSADLKSWTFTLRPGISFSDGTPVNAAAVVTQFNALKALPGCGCAADVAHISKIEAVERPRRAVHARPGERGLPRVPRRPGRLPRRPVVVGRGCRHHDQPPGRQRSVQAADPRQVRVRPQLVVLAEVLDGPEAALPRQDHLRAAGRLHGTHPRRQGRHRRHLPDGRHRQPRAGPPGPEPDRAAHQRQQLDHHRAQLAQAAVRRHPAAAGLQLRHAPQRPEHGLLRELPPARLRPARPVEPVLRQERAAAAAGRREGQGPRRRGGGRPQAHLVRRDLHQHAGGLGGLRHHQQGRHRRRHEVHPADGRPGHPRQQAARP